MANSSNARRDGSDQPLPIRWWPAWVVGLGMLLLTVREWWGEAADEQMRNLGTLGILLGGSFLLLLWWLFFSRAPKKLRLWAFLGSLAAVGAFFGLFRVEGVTGNFMPVLSFRWFQDPTGLKAGSQLGRVDIASSAHDFPQFLGPARDGKVPNVSLAKDWSQHPPRELWRRPVGAGWSGFAVVGQVAVTQEQREDQEVIAAYDLQRGEPLWSLAGPGAFTSPLGGVGPRATPTIEGGQVFTLGPLGLLRAIELATGRLLWQRDAAAENGGQMPEWGYSGSPLLVGSRVVVNVGGKDGKMLVAYHRDTGEPAWQAGEDGAAFSSPMLATLAGRQMILSLNRGSVTGHDPETGQVLWSTPWPRQQPNVAQPVVVSENRVLVSTGYGVGSTLFEIAPQDDPKLPFVAKELWTSPRMKAKFTNLVIHQGDLYGLDDGVLACLDLQTGERRWKAGRYGHGQILLVGDLLLVQTEAGELVLVEPNPVELRELGRLAVLEGKSWNTLTWSGSTLLVRNADEAAAYALALR